ncbi:MAG: SMC-Scp complex subunit ScpB [Pirellulaceae bacterium]|nr:SMC-Scp complex subunit ScpB [Pirellulaceae bacterium]
MDDDPDELDATDDIRDDAEGDGELVELSLDDLGAAYAQAAAKHDPESFAPVEQETVDDTGGGDQDESQQEVDAAEDDVATPETIIEAALFVGHPENRSFSEQRLASLMRDVTPDEVIELIDQLNASYRATEQALRIVKDEQGYRMTIAPAVEAVRRSFLGKVREARLSQAAIEVLALVAYQPGITSQIVQDQRGRESGSLLSQLVRRQLLEMRREKPPEGGRSVPHYYPTERFLTLFGLESLDDLPQVEDGIREAL